jgi:hypothetical protein
MISKDKKYITRSGKEVVIYTYEHPNNYPIVGEFENNLMSWDKDGFYSVNKTESSYDLIEVNPYQEILAEAKRRYKVGDKVLSAYSGDSMVLKCISEGLFEENNFTRTGFLYAKTIDALLVTVYNNGTWAEIVQPEEPKQYTIENINTYNFEQLSGVAKMCMDRMLELSKK